MDFILKMTDFIEDDELALALAAALGENAKIDSAHVAAEEVAAVEQAHAAAKEEAAELAALAAVKVAVKKKKRGRQSSITPAMAAQFDQIAKLERQMMQQPSSSTALGHTPVSPTPYDDNDNCGMKDSSDIYSDLDRSKGLETCLPALEDTFSRLVRFFASN